MQFKIKNKKKKIVCRIYIHTRAHTCTHIPTSIQTVHYTSNTTMYNSSRCHIVWYVLVWSKSTFPPAESIVNAPCPG